MLLAIAFAIILIAVVAVMYVRVSEMRARLERMEKTLGHMVRGMGCEEAKPDPGDADEEFMGYTVTAQTRERVKAIMYEGVITKAEDELRRSARMPRTVAAEYLEQLQTRL